MNTITSIGITGDHGFINGIHYSAPYDSCGRVFVLVSTSADRMWDWRRMSKRVAKSLRLNVIKCDQCDEPAVRLDHFWPYHSEMNSCRKHLTPRDGTTHHVGA